MRIRMFAVLVFALLVAATPLTVTVPSGTHIHFKVLNTIDTATAKAGQHVPAALTEALVVNGVTVAKAGAPAEVRIRNVESSGRIGASAKLLLTLSSITLANGQTAAVQTSSWSREGKAHAKHNATYIVGGAVVGALAGQAIGHDRDATAKGAAAGAGLGIGAAAATGKFDFQVAAGDRFSLRLKTPLKATL